MTKRILVLFLIILIPFGIYWLYTFNKIEAPEFVEVKFLKTDVVAFDNVEIEGVVTFYNPNFKDCKLLNTELKASANGIFLGHIVQTEKVEIPSNAPFSIPLKMKVNPVQIGLTEGISSLVEKALNHNTSFKLYMEGYSRIKVGETVYKVPINQDLLVNLD
jgi:hypothetical protein